MNDSWTLNDARERFILKHFNSLILSFVIDTLEEIWWWSLPTEDIRKQMCRGTSYSRQASLPHHQIIFWFASDLLNWNTETTMLSTSYQLPVVTSFCTAEPQFREVKKIGRCQKHRRRWILITSRRDECGRWGKTAARGETSNFKLKSNVKNKNQSFSLGGKRLHHHCNRSTSSLLSPWPSSNSLLHMAYMAYGIWHMTCGI